MQIEMRIAGDVSTARRAFAGLEAGTAIHGISDGTWSLIDGIRELLRLAGPSAVTLSTWTAAAADLRDAERLLRARSIVDFRLLVDRSFLTRQPVYCASARKLFGDDAIRVWNSHAKFALFRGAGLDVAYLTSANLNKNKRLESWSVMASADVVSQYVDLVDQLFAIQAPGQGFAEPTRGRQDTDRVLGGGR